MELFKKTEKLNNNNRFRGTKIIFLLSVLVSIASKTECIRHKDKLKLQEGGLGSFLLGVAGNALSTGLQAATGSPLLPNPAAGSPGLANALSGSPSLSAGAQGAPGAGVGTTGAPGAVAGMAGTPGAVAGMTGAPGAGAGMAGAPATPPGTPATPAGPPSAPGGMGAGMAGSTGTFPGAAPSAVSFTTISFGLIVLMMICMVMLMCRRCTKDYDDD
ncbi:glutamine-rich protein 2 [Cryptosporidium ryanae]|uniref:glutamine-rich protein 2 n=1 Tax=Cryptosporidium ryanae TaxID=515981 RepID=UPI00351A732D|nr:glutamine-rich protein 2 [Cryptosporidium ryanae]